MELPRGNQKLGGKTAPARGVPPVTAGESLSPGSTTGAGRRVDVDLPRPGDPAGRTMEALPLPPTPSNLDRAKHVALEGWKERASEPWYKQDAPNDLSGACKFASMFAQRLFGGELRGNYDHQFVLLDGAIIDLTEGSEDLNRLRLEGKDPYRHDRFFWGNRDHRDSMKTCEARVAKWVEMYLAQA